MIEALDFFQADTVLLQYSPYGYDIHGCPLWLSEGLRQWKAYKMQRHLVTSAHELFATGQPFRRSFWTSLLQQRIARDVMTLSDFVTTNCENHAEKIRHWKKNGTVGVDVLGSFSNVEEPAKIPSLMERPRRIVTFGQNRTSIYKKSKNHLLKACKLLGVSEIYDIGPPMQFKVSKVGEVPVTQWGIKSAKEVSGILLNCYAGFLTYKSKFLSKASVFAAYCAHGVLCLTDMPAC